MRNKLFILMLAAASMLCVTSCSSEEEISVPQEVEFTVDYSFAESGSMTRASGSEVFDTFFEKYIKTKKITPKTYSLRFMNEKTKATAEFKGYWDQEDGIRLPEGVYVVTGTSAPKGDNYGVSDSVYISFEDKITLTKDMNKLTLKADYNSFLAFFDAQNSKEVSYNTGGSYSHKLKKTEDNIFYIFVNTITSNSGNFGIAHKNNTFSYIYLQGMPFEKGKYYYFNDMTNSFDLPKMESGN